MALLIGSHFLILIVFYHLPWPIAISDSLIFNLLFAVLALPVWYAIIYYRTEKNTISNTIINHASILVIVLLLWVNVGNTILSFIDYDYYKLFLYEALPWRFASGALFYFLVALIYYLFQNYENIRKQEQMRYELEQKIREAQIEALKSQINPHFLFNSLNSINYLTVMNPEKARQMIVKLSDYLRYSISNSQQWGTIGEELDNISRYLEIEQVRFGDKLKFSVYCPEALSKAPLPCMIMQPLLENAVKHGVYESLQQVSVQVEVKEEDQYLSVKVVNDVDPESVKPKKGAGVGLTNIRERLRLHYGSDQYLRLTQEETRFTAELYLPKK